MFDFFLTGATSSPTYICDDPGVVSSAPANIRAPLSAHVRVELVVLASLHSCHALCNRSTSGNPQTLSPCPWLHVLHVRLTNLVTNDIFRIQHFSCSIYIVFSAVVSDPVVFCVEGTPGTPSLPSISSLSPFRSSKVKVWGPDVNKRQQCWLIPTSNFTCCSTSRTVNMRKVDTPFNFDPPPEYPLY